MQNRYENIAISLAGIIQAVELVKQLAQTGKLPEEPFNASIFSIFTTAAENPEKIKWGLKKLIYQLGQKSDRSLTRHMLSLIHLQKKISRSQKLSQHLTQRLTQIQKQVNYFYLTHPTVISNLADTYLETIRHFNFKIIIWGNQRVLNAQENVEKIRALLLAGVKSALLWREVGGSRWQFLFHRTKIKNAAEYLLKKENL